MRTTERPRFCRCNAVDVPTMPAPSTMTSALRDELKVRLAVFAGCRWRGPRVSPLYDELGVDAPERLCYRSPVPEHLQEAAMIPRYTRPEMAAIWAPETRFRTWFEIEAYAADAMAELGIIPREAAKTI